MGLPVKKIPNLQVIERPAWVVSRGQLPENAFKAGYADY